MNNNNIFNYIKCGHIRSAIRTEDSTARGLTFGRALSLQGIFSLLLPRKHATNQMDCEVERAAAEAAPKRPAAVCCCYCGCATKARKDASHKQAGNQLPVCACACAVFDVCSDRCQLHLLSVTVAFRSGNIAEVESKKSNKRKQSQQAKYTQVNLFLVGSI